MNLVRQKCYKSLIQNANCASSLLPRLPKLLGPFGYHWLGNLSTLERNKEIQGVLGWNHLDIICLIQIRLGTVALRTPRSTGPLDDLVAIQANPSHVLA